MRTMEGGVERDDLIMCFIPQYDVLINTIRRSLFRYNIFGKFNIPIILI